MSTAVSLPATPANLLPCDGDVRYYGPILSAAEADRCLSALLHGIAWEHDETVIFGRRIITARQVAWHGDAPLAYTYSGSTKHALPWNGELRALKDLVESHSGATYNSCLLNLYHHGQQGMGWHSDDERTIVPCSAIASLSLGAERKFNFRHRQTGATLSLRLEHGSLLVMQGATQAGWRHCLPKSKKILTPRVNLTFRKMVTG